MTTPEVPKPAQPNAKKKAAKPGWLNWGDHPVVAVLAVLASVATILQLFMGGGKEKSAGPDQALVADLASSAKAPFAKETAKCTEAAGRWEWFPVGGIVAIDKSGTMVWYRLASDRVPTVTGTWDCDLRNPRHYTFRWLQTAQIDTLVLSPDFKRLTGANLASGLRQSGTRAR